MCVLEKQQQQNLSAFNRSWLNKISTAKFRCVEIFILLASQWSFFSKGCVCSFASGKMWLAGAKASVWLFCPF